jgi:toxin FitB
LIHPDGLNTFKDLTISLAINAAKVSFQNNLPMADSIIFATANIYKCTVWTQDSDFENLPGVKFFPKKAPGQQGH